MWKISCWILVCGPLLVVAVPRFDRTSLLKNVLVPADAAVDSVIYRLRASDPTFDYPLVFTLEKESTVVDVVTLNCTRFNSVCQANVLLRKRLEPERFYDFRVQVRNKRNERDVGDCSFKATDATTPIEKIFPGAPTLLKVSESARRNTELGTLVARGNPTRDRPVLLELWGSPEFSLRQRRVNEKDAEGTVILLSSLDYEKSTIHHLTIFANVSICDLLLLEVIFDEKLNWNVRSNYFNSEIRKRIFFLNNLHLYQYCYL